MGMRTGGRGIGVVGEINVTPMIDVLLVLLVIFMVVQQGLQRGIAVNVPPTDSADPVVPPPEELVLVVERGGRYSLNQEPVSADGLRARLETVFADRPRSVLFVKGAEDATYGEVVQALEASRAAGVQVLGLFPREPAG
jgi:biopolymer transport protein TolR